MSQVDLPVHEALPALFKALETDGAAVLVAPPGAGKTTSVPLALLDQPWRDDNRIILLQPRRLAARAAAARMAFMLGEKVGQRVGYRMRLDTKVSPETRIEIVTEGVFQRMISDDPALEGIGCVIFDEFHERSLDADLGLALALDVRGALREDLRLLVMSATLDDERVAGLIGAKIVQSRGRQFPVDIRYQPPSPDLSIEQAMAAAIRQALMAEEGSILAFLPGQAEIRRTHQLLQDKLPGNTFVAPLYGAMDLRDQDSAIQPPDKGSRKIVLATPIAETSITIDDVRIIIDGGLVRQPSYEPSLGIARLVTKRASKASITQRAGRAGRTAPGIAIRLWQRAQTTALSDFETPEIMQVDLSTMLLDCLAWGVNGPADLALLDQPPPVHLAEAQKLLAQLGAADGSGHITAKGKALAKSGLEPRLASMVLEGKNSKDRHRRAFLALLLGERGLGGNSSDMAQRFERAWTDKSARATALKRLAGRIASNIGGTELAEGETSVGLMLCDAFPDRVAKARPDRLGYFVMANGRGIMVDEVDPIAARDFVIAADIIGVAKSARATSLAVLEEDEVLARFSDELKSQKTYSFDKTSGRLTGRLVRNLGAIKLSEAPQPVEPDAAVQATMIAAVRKYGLQILPWTKSTKALRSRLAWLYAVFGAPWPEMGGVALLADLESWLEPFLAGQTGLASLAEGGLENALLNRVPHELQRDIDRLAPTHFIAPTGSKLPLQYSEDGTSPVLSIRVQELFGLNTHPAIAKGKIPLNLELLSPAQRPIQITLDLPAFWKGSWADVRAEMRGRYPRHEWPADPAQAAPTRRAKPRK